MNLPVNVTPFNDEKMPLLYIFEQPHSLMEVIHLRNILRDEEKSLWLEHYLSQEIIRVQEQIFDLLHNLPNHSGMGS